MIVTREELIDKLRKRNIKVIITANRDLSINREFYREIPEDLGYIGVCIYEESGEYLADIWIKSNSDSYEFFENYFEQDLKENYLHHEVIHFLGKTGDLKLKEVF